MSGVTSKVFEYSFCKSRKRIKSWQSSLNACHFRNFMFTVRRTVEKKVMFFKNKWHCSKYVLQRGALLPTACSAQFCTRYGRITSLSVTFCSHQTGLTVRTNTWVLNPLITLEATGIQSFCWQNMRSPFIYGEGKRYQQKQPPEVFCKKKVFLGISQNSQENTCARDSF